MLRALAPTVESVVECKPCNVIVKLNHKEGRVVHFCPFCGANLKAPTPEPAPTVAEVPQ